jgi:hypothetical protein
MRSIEVSTAEDNLTDSANKHKRGEKRSAKPGAQSE